MDGVWGEHLPCVNDGSGGGGRMSPWVGGHMGKCSEWGRVDPAVCDLRICLSAQL